MAGRAIEKPTKRPIEVVFSSLELLEPLEDLRCDLKEIRTNMTPNWARCLPALAPKKQHFIKVFNIILYICIEILFLTLDLINRHLVTPKFPCVET